MTLSDSHASGPCRSRRPGVGFWFLITLGMSGLTPCVLFPVWRDYLHVARAAEQSRLQHQRLSDDVTMLGRKRMLLETDPAVTVRASMRELAFRRDGAVVVPIETVANGHAPRHDLAREPMDPIPAVPALESLSWLSAPAIARSVGDAETRALLSSLSVFVIIAAFVIHAPRTTRPEP